MMYKDKQKVGIDMTKPNKLRSTEQILDDGIMSDEMLNAIIAGYEKQFGISSEVFLMKWKAGEMPDTFETNDWDILLNYQTTDNDK
jgi:hypothetical protein